MSTPETDSTGNLFNELYHQLEKDKLRYPGYAYVIDRMKNELENRAGDITGKDNFVDNNGLVSNEFFTFLLASNSYTYMDPEVQPLFRSFILQDSLLERIADTADRDFWIYIRDNLSEEEFDYVTSVIPSLRSRQDKIERLHLAKQIVQTINSDMELWGNTDPKELTRIVLESPDAKAMWKLIEHMATTEEFPDLFMRFIFIYCTYFNRPNNLLRDETYGPIFQDLLRITIQSEDPSLKQFLEDGSLHETLDQYVSALNYLFLGDGNATRNISAFIHKVMITNQGYGNSKEVLAVLEKGKETASQRNASSTNIQDGYIQPFNIGTIEKSIYPDDIPHMQYKGVVSAEFTFAKHRNITDSSTKLASDVIMAAKETELNPSDFSFPLKSFEHGVYATDHVILASRNRGQYIEGKTGNNPRNQYRYRAIHGNYVAIETGFPLTEVDAIILTGMRAQDIGLIEKLKQDLRNMGLYIPIADSSGRVIFSYEEYKQS